jgi:hypothetical protein
MVSVASNPCGWRRGWDSNPRYGDTVRLISSPPCDVRTCANYAPRLEICFRATRADGMFRAQLGKFPPTNGRQGRQGRQPCRKNHWTHSHVHVHVRKSSLSLAESLTKFDPRAFRLLPFTPQGAVIPPRDGKEPEGLCRFCRQGANGDEANGPCRGRTQDSDGALSPGAAAFRRDRRKPASRPIPRLAHVTGAGQCEYDASASGRPQTAIRGWPKTYLSGVSGLPIDY